MNIQAKPVNAPAIEFEKKEKSDSKLKTEFFRRYFRVVHALFAVLLGIQLIPDQLTTETYASYVIWFALGVEVFTLIVSAFIKKPKSLNLFVDIVAFVYGLLIVFGLSLELILERKARQCGYIHIKILRCYTTYCIYPLRNSTSSDFPQRIRIRYLPCYLLACACGYYERRYEC